MCCRQHLRVHSPVHEVLHAGEMRKADSVEEDESEPYAYTFNGKMNSLEKCQTVLTTWLERVCSEQR